MKKSKVTKVTKLDKKDAYGNTSFIVEFENGDKGFYTSKNENQTKFTTGQEVEYNIEEKTGKEGKKYFKVTPPQSETGGGARFGGKPQIDPKIQMISFAMAYTKDLVVAGKVNIENMGQYFDKIYSIMTSKI